MGKKKVNAPNIYQRIIEIRHGEHRCKVGDSLGAYAPCNRNGRQGWPMRGVDTDAVTCTHCGPA